MRTTLFLSLLVISINCIGMVETTAEAVKSEPQKSENLWQQEPQEKSAPAEQPATTNDLQTPPVHTEPVTSDASLTKPEAAASIEHKETSPVADIAPKASLDEDEETCAKPQTDTAEKLDEAVAETEASVDENTNEQSKPEDGELVSASDDKQEETVTATEEDEKKGAESKVDSPEKSRESVDEEAATEVEQEAVSARDDEEPEASVDEENAPANIHDSTIQHKEHAQDVQQKKTEIKKSSENESKKPKEKVQEPKKEVLNEVRAVIGGPTETVLILTQDIRPWLDGTPRTLRDLVIEQLILFDAESLKLQPTEEEVDRVILQIQKNNNYTHDKLLEMLKAIDYSMEEFRTDLKRKHSVDMMLDYRVRNDKRMAVNEEDVRAWWDAHSENQFKMITGHIKTKLSADDVAKALKQETLKDSIDWGSPFAVTEAQLPKEKQFITQKEPGQIVLIEPETDGFEITKLISKGKEPLKSGNREQNDKRYKEIERNLRMERYGKIFEEYEQKLLKNAHINFKYEADRIAVMGK